MSNQLFGGLSASTSAGLSHESSKTLLRIYTNLMRERDQLEATLAKVVEQVELWNSDVETNRPDFGGANYRRRSLMDILSKAGALKSE